MFYILIRYLQVNMIRRASISSQRKGALLSARRRLSGKETPRGPVRRCLTEMHPQRCLPVAGWEDSFNNWRSGRSASQSSLGSIGTSTKRGSRSYRRRSSFLSGYDDRSCVDGSVDEVSSEIFDVSQDEQHNVKQDVALPVVVVSDLSRGDGIYPLETNTMNETHIYTQALKLDGLKSLLNDGCENEGKAANAPLQTATTSATTSRSLADLKGDFGWRSDRSTERSEVVFPWKVAEEGDCEGQENTDDAANESVCNSERLFGADGSGVDECKGGLKINLPTRESGSSTSRMSSYGKGPRPGGSRLSFSGVGLPRSLQTPRFAAFSVAATIGALGE
eukprot:GHVN01092295.1.p1 GENE.GHVN01092295.1~~GHVN01092295.1.p1  ORF type:complete len:335 (+),score=33.41 GHVN01092295.1:613-1617(+)